MNGEVKEGNQDTVTPEDDLDMVDSSEDTIVLSEDADDIDTVGDFTAELDVEKIVAKVESGEVDAAQQVLREATQLFGSDPNAAAVLRDVAARTGLDQ